MKFSSYVYYVKLSAMIKCALLFFIHETIPSKNYSSLLPYKFNSSSDYNSEFSNSIPNTFLDFFFFLGSTQSKFSSENFRICQ